MMAGFCLDQTELGRGQRDFFLCCNAKTSCDRWLAGFHALFWEILGRDAVEEAFSRIVMEARPPRNGMRAKPRMAAPAGKLSLCILFRGSLSLSSVGSGSKAVAGHREVQPPEGHTIQKPYQTSNMQRVSQATGSWTSLGSPSTAAHSQGFDAFLGKTGPPPPGTL